MKTMKYILGIFVLFALGGCEDWFDVKPENEIVSNDLYATGDGFRMQINGIYKNLSTEQLYARELSWGFLDVLGQYYIREDLNDTDYKDLNDRKYGTSGVKEKISGVWSGMYKVIADCNNVIDYVSKASDDIFEYGAAEKAKVHGEALAMRAFIHFDLLRMFAPAPNTKDQNLWIPYVTNYYSVINPRFSVNKVLELVVNDLLEAHKYMVQWDSVKGMDSDENSIRMWDIIRSYWWSYDKDEELPQFFGSQCYRMNMVSVQALLARVYAYMGEKEKAYNAADLVLKMGGRYEEWDFDYEVSNSNCKMSGDVIFALYNKKNADYYASFLNTSNALYIRNINQLFPDRNKIDVRFEQALLEFGNVRGKYVSLKNRKDNERIEVIPIIRKSELYYIMGEYLANVGRVDEAVDMIRSVRERRGDISTEDLDDIRDENGYIKAMLTDARKEFIGEGQSFFMYKRLNLPVFDGLQDIDFRNMYMLPVPSEEESIL